MIRRTGRFLRHYREHAKWLERTYTFVPRVGIDKIRAVVVDDAEGTAEQLDANVQRSVDAYRDPWQDGRNPVTGASSSQFAGEIVGLWIECVWVWLVVAINGWASVRLEPEF